MPRFIPGPEPWRAPLLGRHRAVGSARSKPKKRVEADPCNSTTPQSAGRGGGRWSVTPKGVRAHRCRGDRPVRPGHQTGVAAFGRCRDHGPGRADRAASADHSDANPGADRGRRAARAACLDADEKSIQRLERALQKELAEIDRDIPGVSGTRCSVARSCGATTWISWPRCRASARRSPAPSWPSCRNSACSTAAKSQRLSTMRRSLGVPANGEARIASTTAEPTPAPSWSGAPWSQPNTSRSAKPSASVSSPPESPRGWR